MFKQLLFSVLLVSSNCDILFGQTATTDNMRDPCKKYTCIQGGIVRGDMHKKEVAIVFTGGDYADGGNHIMKVLKTHDAKASFFFTGDFYRNPDFKLIISQLNGEGHYLGAHSDKHLLYCDWNKRDSLLLSKHDFLKDLEANYKEMANFGITPAQARLFMPPYEWYNDSISAWTKKAGFQLVNFTYGTLTNADYTTPEMMAYRSSEVIWQSIVDYKEKSEHGLNGFIMLIHIGTAPERTDKFYHRLDRLISWLKASGYQLKRIDDLITIE